MQIKFVRKIDKLGRIVIPKDVRLMANVDLTDAVEITLENGAVVLKKATVEQREKNQ